MNIGGIQNVSAVYGGAVAQGNSLKAEPQKSQRTDKVEISADGYENYAKAQSNGIQQPSQSELEEMLQQSNESSDATAKALEIKLKCMKIASAIIAGHKVKDKDKKFLLENDSKLYMKAEMLRQKNDKAKKLKQISPEEEKEESEDVSDIRKQLAEDEINAQFDSAQSTESADTGAEGDASAE